MISRLFVMAWSGVWYRIVPAFAEGVTTRQSPDGEPQAAQGAVSLDGLHSITGTGGGEPAMLPDEGAQGIAVDLDQEDKDFSHWLLIRFQSLSRA